MTVRYTTMTTREFDLEKAMKTGGRSQMRDGRQVRIICTDLQGGPDGTCLAIAEKDGDRELLSKRLLNGQYWRNTTSPLDLVSTPVKREGWVNVYPIASGRRRTDILVFETREEADTGTTTDRIACIRIEWEE